MIKKINKEESRTILKSEYVLQQYKIDKILLYEMNSDLYKTLNYDFVESELFDLIEVNQLRIIFTILPFQDNLLKIPKKLHDLFIKLVTKYSDKFKFLKVILENDIFKSLTYSKGLESLQSIGGNAYFDSLTDSKSIEHKTK